MLDVEIDRQTKEEIEKEAYDQALGVKQVIEDGSLCQDLNQHQDEYPNKYYNYHAEQIERVETYPPSS